MTFDTQKTYSHLLDQCNQQAKRIAELEADLDYYKSGFHSERGVHEKTAAVLGTDDALWVLAQKAKERIEKLNEAAKMGNQFCDDLMGNCNNLRNRCWRLEDKNIKQRAALKKLGQAKRKRGKALVEERAKDGAKIPELCDIVHDELMCPALDGDCEHWEGCPRKDELRQKAREELRHEGKL